MTKEAYKYPYNVRREDEIKVFISDQIGEQVVKFTYRNGQIFCTVRDRINSKKKKIILSATIFFVALFIMPTDAKPIGVPVRLPSAPEINRPAPEYFYQYAPTVSQKLDKITFIEYREVPVCIYMMDDRFVKTSVSGIRGGADEKLIRSIISKVSEADWDIPSINKILNKLAEIGTNDKLLRILAELEKPVPNSLFAEGFVPQLPRHRKLNEVEKNKYSSPSIEFLLDSTKCYGHREAYNMPRSVSERFETNAVKKLAKISLKNPRVKKEYLEIKAQIEQGVHPVNLSNKSTYVSSTKVLVKKPEGRYIVDVSDTEAQIVGISSRTNDKSMGKFMNLMNKLYDLNLEGY